MELAFEYLMSKDSLQWIGIKTGQVSVLCGLHYNAYILSATV